MNMNDTTQPERLARFLAHAGVASRRHAEGLIAAGRVSVNGLVIREQGSRVDPTRDIVRVDGQVIEQVSEHVYILLHKPVGYLSTVSDPDGRPTVMNLLPEELQQLRIYPVGRLDNDTSGLLLLTNDGDFALRLTHPRYSAAKHYEALVEGRASNEALKALRAGVTITEDNGRMYKTAPAQVTKLRREQRREGEVTWMNLTIHEGRKRQIRRMLGMVGMPVIQLKRVGIGSLTLGMLKTGHWRYLNEKEIKQLLQPDSSTTTVVK
jgi:pseudouridine synthase